MDPKVLYLEVPYTAGNLLRGLEQNLLNSQGRRQAVHDLIQGFKELDPEEQVRFIAYVMIRCTVRQKQKLAAKVVELFGPDPEMLDNLAFKPWN